MEKKNPLKQARLDFFLISENLSPDLNSCDSELSYRSDHSPIRLKLNFNDFTKGKGLWKLNNSLLYDKQYISEVNNVISQTLKQYALPIYNLENIENIPKDLIQFQINDQLFFDVLLTEIRGKTISYSSYKKKISEKKEKTLLNDIRQLEQHIQL